MNNFSNSPLVDLINLSPHRNSPRNQPIRKITVHHFAGNPTIESVSNFLQQPGRNASYNYGIGSDGRIVLIVEERNRCWASSSPANDHQAVVIGVANNTGAPKWGVSDAAFESLIRLMRCICMRNEIAKLEYTGTKNGNLTRHNFFANTACPGPYLQAQFPEIARRVNSLILAPTSPPRSNDNDDYIVVVVAAGDTLGAIARRHNTTVAELQRLNNIANPNMIRVGQNIRMPGFPPEEQPPPTPTEPPETSSHPDIFQPDHEPSRWAQKAWKWGIQTNITDGTDPQNMPTREQVLQMIFNYHNMQ